MAKSAPNITFDPETIAYGTIGTGSSCALVSYLVTNSITGSTCAVAKNMSICFLTSTNSDEAESESWVYYTTAIEATYVRSTNVLCQAGSVNNEASIVVKTKVKVPASPATSGTVYFKARHKYQYTG